jgi:hypothetical protein
VLLLAASAGVIGTAIVLAVAFYLMPFYFARRIGQRKGRRWFWYVFFFHWLGVLILALRKPKAWAAVKVGSSYHIPPGAQGTAFKNSPLYDRRRR